MTAPSGKIAHLASHLVGLPAAIGQTILENRGQLLPRPSSTAQQEIHAQAQFIGRSTNPVLDTYSLVHVRLLGSMQNLVAIGHLLETGPVEPSCGVLARASLESAAVAAWLLGEPGHARTRVARGRAQHVYELQQDAGILRRIYQHPEGARIVESIHVTVEEIAADCKAVGIEVDRTRQGRVSLREAPAPSASAAIKDLMGDEGLIAYRVLCGSTHGSSNAAIASMTKAPVASALDGVSVVMPANDPTTMIPTLGAVIRAFYMANDRRFEALGWNVRAWAAWKVQIMNTVVQLLP